MKRKIKLECRCELSGVPPHVFEIMLCKRHSGERDQIERLHGGVKVYTTKPVV